MKIFEVISEGRDGKPLPTDTANHGEWKFRDVGGYDRTYHLAQIMKAAGMADGSSHKPVNMAQSSWVEKFNLARPYTEQEHNMMRQAFATVDSEYSHSIPDHKSREEDTVHKVSPVPNPGPIKRRSK
jgi:hypothetical protein